MSFLAPQWLWWMLAATAPIIIHLWHKKERQPLHFFSLRFVPHRTHAQQFSAVHQWWLLLLRVLVLICFSLAMSEPVMQWAVERTETVNFVHPRASPPIAADRAKEGTLSPSNGGDASAWYWLCDNELRRGAQAPCPESGVVSALLYIAEAMPEIKKLNLHLPDGPFHGGALALRLPFELVIIRADKTRDIVKPSFTVKASDEWQSLLSIVNTTHHYERWRWLESGEADVVLDANYLPAKVHWHSKDDLLWSHTKDNALPSFVDGDVLHLKLGAALVDSLAQGAGNSQNSSPMDEKATNELAELLALTYRWLTRYSPPLVERESLGIALFVPDQIASKKIALHFIIWLLAMGLFVVERALTNKSVYARE